MDKAQLIIGVIMFACGCVSALIGALMLLDIVINSK